MGLAALRRSCLCQLLLAAPRRWAGEHRNDTFWQGRGFDLHGGRWGWAAILHTTHKLCAAMMGVGSARRGILSERPCLQPIVAAVAELGSSLCPRHAVRFGKNSRKDEQETTARKCAVRGCVMHMRPALHALATTTTEHSCDALRHEGGPWKVRGNNWYDELPGHTSVQAPCCATNEPPQLNRRHPSFRPWLRSIWQSAWRAWTDPRNNGPENPRK